MPESTDMSKLIPPGVLREKEPSSPASIESERRKRHVRPVWIVLILLLPCLALTFYYAQMAVPVGEESDSFLPSTGYAFVLLLVNLDLIGFVVLTLLLSRNLIKAYFERRHRLVGSGFRAKLVAAFIGFSLIPTVLLALVASGLVNKAVDVWLNDQIEHVMKDSYEVARMHHAGHVSLAINSARAISHEIFREELLLPEQRDLLVAAIARKRDEYATAGIEVFSAKMETLTKALDPEVPVTVLDLPIGQLVLQVINGKQELTSCLTLLGVSALAVMVGDVIDGTPVFETRPCTAVAAAEHIERECQRSRGIAYSQTVWVDATAEEVYRRMRLWESARERWGR